MLHCGVIHRMSVQNVAPCVLLCYVELAGDWRTYHNTINIGVVVKEVETARARHSDGGEA